ncbi:hypothetical protein SUGI_0497300 [Cryptomeria japonica]|nr:hypothetical protein SUGI_0497300 [Cryptomeria japonica]
MREILAWEETHLDIILVPAGLLMFLGYHACLLHKIITRPHTTFIGINAINRRAWVRAIMEDRMKYGVLAVQTIRNSIMSSALLASTAIALCSVVGLLVGVGVGCNCYYSHVSFLITTPPIAPELESAHVEYVIRAFNQGALFWSMGLRAFYLSIALFLWNFGPIPMFISSFLLLLYMYCIDVPSTNLSATYSYPQEKSRTKSWPDEISIPRGFFKSDISKTECLPSHSGSFIEVITRY